MASAWGQLPDDEQQDPLAPFMQAIAAQAGGKPMTPPVVMQQAAQLKPPLGVPRGTLSQSVTTKQRVGPPAANAGKTQSLLDQIDEGQLNYLKQQGLTTDALQKQLDTLNKKEMPENVQPLAALIDSWTGSKLASAFAPDETAQSRAAQAQKMQDAILKSQQGMSADQIQFMKDKLGIQRQAEEMNIKHGDQEIARRDQKLRTDELKSTKDQKRIDDLTLKMGKDFDPSDAVKNGMGTALRRVHAADAIKAMVGGRGMDIDKRQMEELAISLQSLVSGNNSGSVAQVAALVPDSARGSAAKLQEWLTNEPQGLKQQAFVHGMMTTVNNEAKLGHKELQQYLRGRMAKHAGLKELAPDRYDDILHQTEREYGTKLRYPMTLTNPKTGDTVEIHDADERKEAEDAGWE